MGCESTVLTEMEKAGFRASTKLVFLFLREAMRCEEVGRLAVSRGWLSEATGYSDKVGRLALQQLEKAGWISVQRSKGKFNFVRVLHRAEGQVKGQVKGQVATDGKLEEKGQVKGQPKGHTGVSCSLDVSLGVKTAVDSPVQESVLQKTAAKKSAAFSSQQKAKQREQTTPGWRKLCDHVTATWTEKKRGLKPSWPKDAWVNLWRQTKRLQCHEIAALWDGYLALTDMFITGEGHPLTWFCNRKIDGLTDVIDYKRRGAAYEAFWQGNGPDPRPKKFQPATFTPKSPAVARPTPTTNPPVEDWAPEEAKRRHLDVLKLARRDRCKSTECQYCKPAVVSDAELMAQAVT